MTWSVCMYLCFCLLKKKRNFNVKLKLIHSPCQKISNLRSQSQRSKYIWHWNQFLMVKQKKKIQKWPSMPKHHQYKKISGSVKIRNSIWLNIIFYHFCLCCYFEFSQFPSCGEGFWTSNLFICNCQVPRLLEHVPLCLPLFLEGFNFSEHQINELWLNPFSKWGHIFLVLL